MRNAWRMVASTGRSASSTSGADRRRRLVVLLTILVTLGLILLAAVAWSRLVSTLRDATPVASPSRPHVNGVVWGSRVFTQKKPLERWLAARGTTYAQWERRHKSATRLLVKRTR